MSRRILHVKVASTTNHEGDLQEYRNAEDAVLYSAELVDDGFDLDIQINRNGAWETISYEDLITLAQE